jgi:hypothetical protein
VDIEGTTQPLLTVVPLIDGKKPSAPSPVAMNARMRGSSSINRIRIDRRRRVLAGNVDFGLGNVAFRLRTERLRHPHPPRRNGHDHFSVTALVGSVKSSATQASAQFERLGVISCTLGRVKIGVADERRVSGCGSCRSAPPVELVFTRRRRTAREPDLQISR